MVLYLHKHQALFQVKAKELFKRVSRRDSCLCTRRRRVSWPLNKALRIYPKRPCYRNKAFPLACRKLLEQFEARCLELLHTLESLEVAVALEHISHKANHSALSIIQFNKLAHVDLA